MNVKHGQRGQPLNWTVLLVVTLALSIPVALFKSGVSEHVVAVRPRGETTTRITTSEDAVTAESFFDSRDIRFTHIPKCAGTSFIGEVKPAFHTQNCFDVVSEPDSFNAFFLRDPVKHVHSQFMECYYDGWGLRTTKGTDFPRTDDIGKDFSEWLKHFETYTDDDFGQEKAYRCIDPRNVQARHLSCTTTGLVNVNTALSYPPSYESSLARIRGASYSTGGSTFVGITEFYHESLCMIRFRHEGTLPAGCGCDEEAKSAKASHIHQSHGVPSHSSEFSGEDLRLIEKYTTIDRPLYVEGMKRFLHDIDVAETLAGKKFLCDRSKAMALLKKHEGASIPLEDGTATKKRLKQL